MDLYYFLFFLLFIELLTLKIDLPLRIQLLLFGFLSLPLQARFFASPFALQLLLPLKYLLLFQNLQLHDTLLLGHYFLFDFLFLIPLSHHILLFKLLLFDFLNFLVLVAFREALLLLLMLRDHQPPIHPLLLPLHGFSLTLLHYLVLQAHLLQFLLFQPTFLLSFSQFLLFQSIHFRCLLLTLIYFLFNGFFLIEQSFLPLLRADFQLPLRFFVLLNVFLNI